MATVPPFNNPPPGPGPQPTPNLQDYLNQWEQLTDSATEFHNSLLDQVKAIKAAREETKNVYDLQDQLNKLLKEEEDIAKAKESLESKASQQAKIALDAIKDGFEARRKQGEELTKFQQLQNAINAAELSSNANTIEGQQKIEELKQKAIRQEQHIFDLKNQEQTLSKILTGEYQKQNTALSEADKKIIAQYLHQQKLGEELDEYLKNHNIDLKVQQSIIDAQKAQLTTWQKINQQVDNLTNKVKSIKVVSDTWDWGKKQFDTLIGGGGIQGLLNMVLEYGKTLTDAAKQLGISVNGVRALAGGYEDTAMRAKEINSSANAAFLTTKNQLAAQQELNAALGTSGLVTEQARVDQVTLTKQMGLQADEAAKLYQLGLLNKTSADAVSKTVAQQVINLKQQRGIQLNLKTVLQDVAKVSAQLSAQYGSNPEKIAAAVVKAKELGLTIEQTAGMSAKLLDFQSSIENELKAELLTGRALNLEQARYFALMGDTAKAAEELMNQVGNLEDYQKLNVIQQQSLAEAIGMSKEELAESFKQQELLRGSTFATQAAFEEAIRNADTEQEKAEILAKIKQSDNAEQLTQQYQQISAQEKFNQAVEKLKEMVASFVDGPFGSFLDGLANAVSSAENLKGIMYAIGTIMVGNMLRGIVSFGIQMAAAIAPTSAVAAASIATASAITLGIGIAAVIAGLVAGASALSSATGENVNVSAATGGATGGGISAPTVPTSTRPPQDVRPINIQLQADGSTIQNWTNVGNKTLSTGRQA